MLKPLLILGLSFSVQAANFHTFFEATEHTVAGDEVILRSMRTKKLHLPNGLEMSFGEIISMGDFYGVPEEPISQGEDAAERRARFVTAFDLLAKGEEAVKEVPQIIAAIHTEMKRVTGEVLKGRSPGEVFDEGGSDRVKRWNCITGGACSGLTWWLTPGRYLLLAEKNFDHFGDNAILAYMAGHEAALLEAASGHLQRAYAMEAFANHFLTDRFASGHIRVPRVELPNNVTPSAVGSLLAAFMHNEECSQGLHVQNKQGDMWVAYGDGRYTDSRNQNNRRIMQKALQIAADEIHEAFQNKKLPVEHAELNLIPYALEDETTVNLDVAPMFYWDAGAERLMRRANLSDPFSKEWTDNWWGTTTLAELQMSRGRW